MTWTDTQTFLDGRVTLFKGDCLEVLAALPENSVDAIITDPPYHFDTILKRFGGEGASEAQHGTDGLFRRASAGFMGKQWDGGDIAFDPATWAAALRVLKPGGHLAAFAAPKCVHKMGVAIELAGFEVRDRIINLVDPDPALAAFLDSLSPCQADALFRLTDHFGALGEAFWTFGTGFPKSHDVSKAIDKLLGAEREKIRIDASQLKNPPNLVGGAVRGDDRPWRQMAQEKSFHEKDSDEPVSDAAREWQGWGTGLKPAYEPIVIARKPVAESSVARQVLATGTGAINVDACRVGDDILPAQTRGVSKIGTFEGADGNVTPERGGRFPANLTHDGSEAVLAGLAGGDRFFFSAKADAHDRIGSGHPTVKPVDLMQWLVRMLTPKGGTVLDMFSGTGTTGEAAWREGMNAWLIEREPDYQADIARRMENADAGPATRRAAGQKAKAARRGDMQDHGPLFGGLNTPPETAGRYSVSSPMKAEGDVDA